MNAYFFIYKDEAGFWRWKFVSEENRIVATSAEASLTRLECEREIAMLKRDAGTAELCERAKFGSWTTGRPAQPSAGAGSGNRQEEG